MLSKDSNIAKVKINENRRIIPVILIVKGIGMISGLLFFISFFVSNLMIFAKTIPPEKYNLLFILCIV